MQWRGVGWGLVVIAVVACSAPAAAPRGASSGASAPAVSAPAAPPAAPDPRASAAPAPVQPLDVHQAIDQRYIEYALGRLGPYRPPAP